MSNDPDEKFEVLDDITYAYSTSWIHSLEAEEHWRLYWRQQKLMQDLVVPGQHVLEIGLGSGFTATYLRSKGVNVTTIDIDPDKHPDIVANIVSYEFSNIYDAILAFEVFEHIPYQNFTVVLERLARACRYLFLSVPRNKTVWFRLVCKLPKLRPISIELGRRQRRITEGHHWWEVDHGQITVGRLEDTFREYGFEPLHRDEAFCRLFYGLRSRLIAEQAGMRPRN